jgi:hypothetical protein
MKIIDETQLTEWVSGAKTDFYFVVVKTPTCSKCDRLSAKMEEAFGRMTEKVAWFVFKPGSGIGTILQDAGCMGAPSVLSRYQEKGKWRVTAIQADFSGPDYTDALCIFDAFADRDYGYFGYNEFGDVIYEGDADFKMDAIMRGIWGQDQNAINERNRLKAEVTN